MSKVIDVREGGGELVVLGRAVVLPASTTDGAAQPLDGSIRFNPTNGFCEMYVNSGWTSLGGLGGGSGAHSHPISEVSGLQAALDAKALATHTHPSSSITGLDTALSGKAPLVHTHATDDIAGLDGELAALATQIADLDAAKANVSHTHTIASVAGLFNALDGKAQVGHHHAMADIGDLQGQVARFTRDPHYIFKTSLGSGVIHRIMIGSKTQFPQNFSGSRAKCTGTPGASRLIDVKQNGTLVGTITVQLSGFIAFTTTSPLGVICLPGDDITFETPTADGAITNIAITLLGETQL